MVANAEELLAKVKEEHGNQMSGPVFKLDGDSKFFPFGALLRKLSINELPQLLNVFMGDMSLVGPRPLPLYEVEAFSELSHRRRLSVKPNITCEWQAGGRNQITSFDEWVEMDLKYIDNWSIWLDLKILLRTVPAVLFGKGAAFATPSDRFPLSPRACGFLQNDSSAPIVMICALRLKAHAVRVHSNPKN
jgi:lipopolysaccharide/colanic/teichoic acid biosynthesis glycosyltransferase